MISCRVGTVTVNIIELNVVIQVASNKVHGVRDLDGLGKLSVRFQIPGFVCGIF